MSFELRQLRYFLAVAEERHFGRAAERLRIAQSGVSQQIRALERSLRVELFERHSRGVDLTPAGSVLVDEARSLVRGADRIEDLLPMAASGARGLLRVAVGAPGLHPLAGTIADAFRERRPDVVVEMIPGSPVLYLRALERRDIDLAFVSVPTKEAEGLAFIALGSVELMVAMSERHPLASMERIETARLREAPFISWPRAFDPTLMDHIHTVLFGEVPPPSVRELNDFDPAVRLGLVAASDSHVAIAVPSEAALRLEGVVHRPLDPPPFVEYGIVTVQNHDSPHVEAFLASVRTHMDTHMETSTNR